MRKPYFRDWLFLILILVPIGFVHINSSLAQSIGQRFEGVVIDYNVFANSHIVSPDTPPWWPNIMLLQPWDQLQTINGVPYSQALRVLRETTSDTVVIGLLRNGQFFEQAIPISILTWSHFLDFRAPYLIMALCMWLLGILLYRSAYYDRLSRIGAICAILFALSYATNRANWFFTNASWWDPLMLYSLLVPIQSATFIHTVFYMTRIDRGRYWQWVIRGGYFIAGCMAIVWAARLWLGHSGQPSELVRYLDFGHTQFYNLIILFSPFILISRLCWFLVTQPQVDLSMRRTTQAFMFGILLAIPGIILGSLNSFLETPLLFFLQYLDLRYFTLFPAILLTGAIVRYQTFRTNSRTLFFIPMLALSGLGASFVNAVFFSVQSPEFIHRIVPPFIPAFLVLCVISAIWIYQTSWRGWYGRILFHEHRHFRDVQLFGQALLDWQDKLPKRPEFAVVKAFDQQYDLQVVQLWLWKADQQQLVLYDLEAVAEQEGLFLTPTEQQSLEMSKYFRLNAVHIPVPAYLRPLLHIQNAELAIPLIGFERLLGVVILGKRRDQEILVDRDIEILILCSLQAALFLEVLHQKAVLQRSNDYIHDTTQQFLYQLNVELTLVSKRVEPTASEGVIKQLYRIRDEVRENAQILRDITNRKLKPKTLSDLELLFKTFRQHHPIYLLTDLTCYRPLSAEIQTEIYYWVKESLHNVVKHAHASNIQVTLREDKQQLILKIRDDGVGFPTHQHLDGGLKRMQERVSDFNGNFMLHQLESKGCEIHIAIPL
nr:hypothetical protein [Anaerolineae bacterium]